MRKLLLAVVSLLAAVTVRADQLLPIGEGTNWQYEATETLPGAAPVRSVVTVRVGRELLDGKETVKLETFSGDNLTRTELVSVDQNGVACLARSGKDGKIAKLNPPEAIIAAPLEVGTAWELEGEVLGNKIHQRFSVVAEENVTVPAGTFRAFHLHCEDASLMSVKLDRWFAPGTGFVKESAVVRGPGMVQRATLELTKFTEVISKPVASPSPAPEKSPEQQPEPPSKSAATPSIVITPSEPAVGPSADQAATPAKKLTVEVSSDPAGGQKTQFKSDIVNIYVRWHGHDLPEGAAIRVAWIAEDVGDLVEPNFVIDETESVAPTSDASARFTLGRPPDGWAEGKYRVEFYVDEVLTETVRVTIVK